MLQNENASLIREKSEIESDLARLREENSRASRSLQAKDGKYRDQDRRLRELQVELQISRNNNSELDAIKIDAQSRVSELERINSLTKKEAEAQKRMLTEQLQELRQQQTDANKRYQQLERSYKTKLAESESKVKLQTTRSAAQEREISELKRQLKAKDASIAEIPALKKLLAESQSVRETEVSLKSENKRLRYEVEKYKSTPHNQPTFKKRRTPNRKSNYLAGVLSVTGLASLITTAIAFSSQNLSSNSQDELTSCLDKSYIDISKIRLKNEILNAKIAASSFTLIP